MAAASQEWVYNSTHGVYYQAASQMFAIANASGQWEYVPITDFRAGESSRSGRSMKPTTVAEEKEDGEVDDDVGWGGLMEPDDLKRATTGADPYGDAREFAYAAMPSPPAEVPKHILRLVVVKSTVLPEGGMVMIDAREGGIHLGRDRVAGQARLRVKEMEVSKTHAVVYWGRGCERVEESGGEEGEEGWWIVDLGSTHGTRVNDHRISEPKESSLPHRLYHLNTLTLGHTTFSAHIHPSWPCDACQLKADTEIKLDDGAATPAVTAESSPQPSSYAMDSKDRRDIREMKRKREMAALRENLLNPGSSPAPASVPEREREYHDRAAMRRRLHPPSPPRGASPTQSPITSPVPALQAAPGPMSKFAAGIMASQGWKQGQGLGKEGAGRANAIEVEMRTAKRGLGSAGSKAVVDSPGAGDWRHQGKQRRYDELRHH